MVDGKSPFTQKSFKHIGSKLVQNLNDVQLAKYHEKKNFIQHRNIETEMFATHQGEISKNRKTPVDSPS
jgi:hypothetical protein